MIGYKTVLLLVASLFFIPALVVGGGFIIAALLAGAVLLVGIGGPKLWQLHNNKALGAKGRNTDVRDYMSPAQSSREQPRVERGDGEEP